MMWLLILSAVIGLAASAEDLRRRKVPNMIPLATLAGGLAGRTALFGLSGTGESLAGTAIGFGVFLVFYLLGGMGAGDIKLMAGFGAIIGSEKILVAAIMAALVGAVMAIGYLLVKAVLRKVRPSEADAGPLRKLSIPYAPAITIGVLSTFLTEGELWTDV